MIKSVSKSQNNMSLVAPWNCEKFSLQDVLSFLNEKGYGFALKDYGEGYINQIIVKGTDITLDIPTQDKDVDQIFSTIHFNSYPKTEQYDESKKLFETLRRRFGKKKDERRKMQFIKDEHLNKEIYKRLPKVGDDVGTKKGWKFWK